jgi:hypothetical protein
MATVLWDRKEVLMVEFHATRDNNNVTNALQNTKKNCIWPFRTKGVEC